MNHEMPFRRLKADSQMAMVGVAALCVVAAAWLLGAAGTEQMSPRTVTWMRALFLAPVIEELFFRGVVQAGLRRCAGFRGQPWLAVGVTAVLFAAAHLIAASALHSLLVIAPACLIGWVYERTRSIGICIVLHSAANAIWLGYWGI